MCLFQLHVLIERVIDGASGDLLLNELGLILCDDLEGVQDTRQGGLGTNALDWVLVEEVINPRDLRDLVGFISHIFLSYQDANPSRAYGCEVSQSSSGVRDQIVNILLLVNESIVTTKTEIGSDIPSD